MPQEQGLGASSQSEDRAATPSEPSQSSVVSGVAGIPCAFTPGPWRTGPAHVVAQQTTDEQGRRVTRFVAEACCSYPLVEGEREANARLIAAAPELYEALAALQLQALQSTVNEPSNEWGREALDFARAALAKARGQ